MKLILRVFRCDICGHKLRFGTSRCSACTADTPVLNRKGLWYILFGGAAAAVAYAAL